ncbi:hypothetical protein [Gemmatimonas sp.]|jgi:hypothetical protein|uniref:hypothetical protein n=1 Tax=Gemmatimonas sp. TaxID=1962908 RepID=UPI0022BCC847|nr:hypothetical protein [Gemmatimonas sp.]MCZ8012021.1 hypothetical protein [Gemmatimonas sp.]MCZ8267341.1 hypothetical protein [Gemmatimonas sp.]
MHQGTPYGHLALDGISLADEEVARMVGIAIREYRKLLIELERHRVFSRTDTGVIFSRRMVRDEEIRNARAAGGEKGAVHGIKGKESGRLGGRPKLREAFSETPLTPPLLDKKKRASNPPPSSSPSASSTLSPIAADAAMLPPPASPAAIYGDEVSGSGGWPALRAGLLSRFSNPTHRSAVEGFLRSAQSPEHVGRRLLMAIDAEGGGHSPEIVGQALDDMLVNGVTRFHGSTFTGYLRRLKESPPDARSGIEGPQVSLEEKILNEIRIGKYA